MTHKTPMNLRLYKYYMLVQDIAEFTDGQDAVICKQSDFTALENWVRSLPDGIRKTVPQMNILPMSIVEVTDEEGED